MDNLMAPRWRGQRGRLEVWYTTLTDPVTGTGVWLHHELVAPVNGDAHTHGWAAVFPPGGPPVHGRYGPDSCTFDGVPLSGVAGDVSWDLVVTPDGAPLFTFPRWAWNREMLPASQIVPAPASTYDGVVRWGGGELELRKAPGATARIYGHGNARRWTWLHADLGGGDVLEVVAAVSTRPLLRALPPLTFLRLRHDGREWPRRDPLLAAPFFRADVGFPRWTVTGHGIRVEVSLPVDNTLELTYTNPDGTTVTCRNSERASCVITLGARRWELDGTAHAEVGG